MAEDGDELLMIDGQGEVWEAKEEVAALVNCPAGCKGLSLDRAVGLFCLGAEPSADKYCLPTVVRAPGGSPIGLRQGRGSVFGTTSILF